MHSPEATLQSALFAQLDQTLDEATNQLEGNYAASIKDYDRAMDHMLMVAVRSATESSAGFRPSSATWASKNIR
jgi:hypothetical protein